MTKRYGKLTRNGYRRVYCPIEKRYKMEHIVVWERYNGFVPEGYQIHHRNGDKLDNRIENLELVDPELHKRLHGGCEEWGGIWWKPCQKCGTYRPISHYYKRKDGIASWCQHCCIEKATLNRRRRMSKK